MTKTLIIYGTTEGQTAKIADFMTETLRAHGHEVDVAEIKAMRGISLGDYDGVIVGASIHMGKHDKHVVKFVQQNLEQLAARPSGFFSVSLAAHGDPEEAKGYVEQFEQQTGWRPDRIALFSGALLYTQYGFIKRRLMKKIAEDKPGELGTDTSRDYVYTEWDAVRSYVEDVLADLAAKSDAPGG